MDIFSGCHFTFIKGNHERRFEKYLLENAPELIGVKGTTVEEQLDLPQKGVEFVDNLKLLEETGEPYNIGQLYYFHGHELSGAGVHTARNKYMKVQKNLLFAHYHCPQSYFHKSFNDVYGAFCTGCLCDVNPSYAPAAQHIQGFAIVEHEEDGTFSVQNKTIIYGRVY